MSAPCLNCASETFVTKKVWFEAGKLQGLCDQCGTFFVDTVADVFFKGTYKSEALGVEFTSRGQKAAYLKEHGIREAGDEPMSTKTWIEGSRDYRKKKFDREDRPKLRQTIRDWRAAR